MNVKLLPLALLILIAGMRVVNAQTNYSLSFNGSSAHVNYTNSTSYSNTMTVEAWIKTTANSSYDEIVGWGNTSSSTNHAVEFRVANGKLEFGINTNGWQNVASGGYVNTGNWVHVAFVKDASSIKLYINGVQDGSGTIDQSPSVNVMEIGGFYYQQEMKPDYYFSGNIDEVRIWNTARTASQISDNLYKELEGGESGLTAYYKMNEGSGTTLYDNKTGGSANGTINNATYTYGPPALTAYTFNSNTYGSGSWIGYVYQSPNSPPSPSFQPSQYLGSVTQTEKFNQNWGSSGPTLNGTTYIDNFHIRYRIEKSFARGKYNITAGGDDGYRLSVDGGATQIINDWNDHGYRTSTVSNVLLDANTLLVLDFYENGGGAQISFDYTQVCLCSYIPASLTATATGTTTATIGWSANGNDGTVSYSWAVKNLSGTTVSNGSTNSTSTSVSGLTANTPYYFTVVSSNTCGSSNLATSSNFSTLPNAPTISSFTPELGMTGTIVTITGTNFTGATAVSFGGTAAASFTVVSATSITAAVATGTTGSVSVTTAGGTATLAGFTYTDTKTTTGSGNWHDSNIWSPSGAPAASENVTINHNIQVSDNAFASPASCNNLTIGNEGSITVQSGKALTVTGSITNSDNSKIMLLSGSSLIENSGTAATVKRSIAAGEWHLISAPVSNATAGIFNGHYLQKHTESSDAYTDITSPDEELTPMKGYALWGDLDPAEATFTGQLNAGDYNFSTTAVTYNGTTHEGGWNLVGNPYPSSIDWEAASGWTKTNVNSAIYCHKNSSTWATWVPGSPNGVSTNGGSRYIAPGQGFFVQATAAGSLAMTDDVRVHHATTFFKSTEVVPNLIRLEVSGNGYKDEAVFRFLDEASAEFDGAYDAHKLFGDVPEAPQIYTLGSTELSINSMPETSVVPVGVKAGNSGTFVINATEINDMPYATLEDTKTGIFTELSKTPYTFDSAPGDNEIRFKLHFSALSVDENKASDISIYSYHKTAYINLKNQLTGDIFIYNMAGQLITSREAANGLVPFTLNTQGVYIVKVVSDNEIMTKRIFINQ